ncbi:MAG: hypothetical protein FWF51_11985 [Chitinivibrionia bacterium]|nr:hypothetical protein [Chitinivibrionia bacterium]
MSETVLFDIDSTDDFDGNVERFVKKKNFRKLPKQLEELKQEITNGIFNGTLIRKMEQPIKHEIYKLRMKNEDTNDGKSNGYRIVYAVMADEKLVLLVTVYYKKEQTDVSDNFVDGLIEGYLLAQNDIEEED